MGRGRSAGDGLGPFSKQDVSSFLPSFLPASTNPKAALKSKIVAEFRVSPVTKRFAQLSLRVPQGGRFGGPWIAGRGGKLQPSLFQGRAKPFLLQENLPCCSQSSQGLSSPLRGGADPALALPSYVGLGGRAGQAGLNWVSVPLMQPQSLVDELLSHKLSEDQIELKEKQLSTMRVDVCSTETLKCLKGKGGRTGPDPPASSGTQRPGFYFLPWGLISAIGFAQNAPFSAFQTKPEGRNSPRSSRRPVPSWRSLSTAWTSR